MRVAFNMICISDRCTDALADLVYDFIDSSGSMAVQKQLKESFKKWHAPSQLNLLYKMQELLGNERGYLWDDYISILFKICSFFLNDLDFWGHQSP